MRLAHVPDGYELVMAGQGTAEPTWGSDTDGSTEPLLVLGDPELDDPTDGRLFVVSVAGYAGNQGGFGQVSAGYVNEKSPAEDLKVAGRPALYTPANPGWRGPEQAEIVVDHSGDAAVRVTGPGASRAELVAVAERVTTRPGEGRTVEPVVDEPPSGLAVLSEADAHVVVGVLGAYVPDPRNRGIPGGTDVVPGTAASYAVGYRKGGASLAVLSVPGGPDALLAASQIDPGRFEPAASVTVAGRPGVVMANEEREDGGAVRRTLVVVGEGGGLIVVAGDGIAVESLVAVAAGVEPIDASTWEAQVVEARGGPGLRPDRDAVELARGEAEGVGWVLQAVEATDDNDFFVGPRNEEAARWALDPCLRLAEGRHACAYGGSSSADLVVHTSDEPPWFMSGMAPPAAVRARVRTRQRVIEVDTVAIPERDERAFVVFGQFDLFTRLELLAADGTVVARHPMR